MSKRGPQPTPTAVLKLRGSRLVAGREGEVEPLLGIPDKPEWLDGEASDEWDRQTQLLHDEGRLALEDRAHLAMFCAAWGEFVEAAIFVQENGATTVTDKGNVIQHPMVGIRNKSREAAIRIGQQFGFSPSSRVGLKAEQKPPTQDGKKRFFTG